MKCPLCGSDTAVVDTKMKVDLVRRRRKCLATKNPRCKYRFATVEGLEDHVVFMSADKTPEALVNDIKELLDDLLDELGR